MSADNGGPAFPHDAPVNGFPCPGPGMTLRDYFAAKVMQAQMSTEDIADDFDEESIARRSYRFADAMLKARAK